jgi:hypothetical protein
MAVGALDALEQALYLSAMNVASLGYGGILLSSDWRFFGAIETTNGVILFAWSAAFLFPG